MVDEKKEEENAGEEEASGFKVTDKRKFSDGGERKEEPAAAPAEQAAEPQEEAGEADAEDVEGD